MAISTGRHEEAFKVLLYDPNPINRGVIQLAIESQTEEISLLVAGSLGEIRTLGSRNRPSLLLWSVRRLCLGTLYSIGTLRLLSQPTRIVLLISQPPPDIDPILLEHGSDFGVDQVISSDITLADLADSLFRWSTVEGKKAINSSPDQLSFSVLSPPPPEKNTVAFFARMSLIDDNDFLEDFPPALRAGRI